MQMRCFSTPTRAALKVRKSPTCEEDQVDSKIFKKATSAVSVGILRQ
tara:strand:- start:612 stop:752 length:141 start_codon:yes stop_codon:yes gene_type:complete